MPPEPQPSQRLTWQWQTDREGRLVRVVSPGRIETRVTYGQPDPDGAVTSAIELDGVRRRFRHDARGRLRSARGADGTLAFDYTTAGLPAEVRSDGAPILRYAYDVQDRLTEMSIGETVLRYRYDYLARLAAVVTPAGEISYTYHRATNTVLRRLPNGIRTLRKYDDEGKLLELTHVDGDDYVVAKYAYAFRPDGRVDRITEYHRSTGEKVWRYGYDLMRRLTAADRGDGGHSYRYDPLGNLAEWRPAGGAALRFESTPAGALARDSRGASRTDERGHVRQLPGPPEPIDYDFDQAGRLAAATGRSVRYRYDALGLLTEREVHGRATRFLPDPFADAWRPLWRRDAAGTENVTVWDGAVPLLELRGDEALYRLEDHLGSVRAEVDGGGGITAWHDYSPYGMPEKAADGDDLVAAYGGLSWDPVARVYLAKVRAYDPVTARFLQPDPELPVPGAPKHSHSLYAYCGGDPVNFVDETGASPVPVPAGSAAERPWEISGEPFPAWLQLGGVFPSGRSGPFGSPVAPGFPTNGASPGPDAPAPPGLSRIPVPRIPAPPVPMSTAGPGQRGGRAGGITRPDIPHPPDPSHRTAPSPVGGVYLGGTGKALEGLDRLRGVAVDDATGKIVLIGADEGQTALPPLRLDDVVTVFRAVYDHGAPPSVTIDPDERDPKGPTMNVTHGPGTEGTYVGWVLFECDRIMKTYQLGQDNVTGDPVSSQVAGFSDTIHAVFFGDPSHGNQGSTWERFWIVPAAVRRFDAAADLSLFELPLQVNTQKMRWDRGKLVDDEGGRSSVGARAFRTWFSEHFDEIAEEALLTPPSGNGFQAPVPIFQELRRIALITAVAERLRDLGQPMPLWMRDHPVAPFPVSRTTPSLRVEKKEEDGSFLRTAQVYGGVNLAPADEDLHAYGDAAAADPASLPRTDAAFVDLSHRRAAAVAPKIPELARADDPVGTIRSVTAPGGETLSAAVLPGAGTRALAPNRRQATDLSVPVGLGRSVDLTRYYNSFFDPVGALGKGWTFDLPELRSTRVPVTRDGKRSRYRTVPHLTSPLARFDIRFDRVDRVEPYGSEMYVAEGRPEIAGLASGITEILGVETRQVLFRDGTEWHFDDGGALVLARYEGSAVRYVREPEGRLGRIVGYVGKRPTADIRLAYDEKSRVVEARATQADELREQAPAEVTELRFEYGEDGRLARVTRPGAGTGESPRVEWVYAYESERLAKIGGRDGAEVAFGYDERGRLLWEQQGDRRTEYDVAATPNGTRLTRRTGDGGGVSRTWTYDGRARPLEADLGGGRTTTWRYGEQREVSQTVFQEGKPVLTRSTSRDGRTETTALTDGPTYALRRDGWGKPAELSRDGILAAQVSWRPDGTLASLRAGGTEVQPRRHEEGWPNGILISAPMEGGRTTRWLEEERDLLGRPVKISDSSGFEYGLTYDERGRLRAFGRLTDGMLTGTSLVYDDDGRIAEIASSWGRERRVYAEAGELIEVEVERQGARSRTAFDAQGRETSREAFDGGSTVWHYDPGEAGARAIDLPNGERIDYGPGAGDDPAGREIRLGPAVVRVSETGEGVTTYAWAERPKGEISPRNASRPG